MLKERNNSILPPSYGSEVLLWATALSSLRVEEEKKSILRGMGGRKTIGDFLERVDVEDWGWGATNICNLCLPGSSVTRCPFTSSLNQKAFSIHTSILNEKDASVALISQLPSCSQHRHS